MMPFLFALGQHAALTAVEGSLDDEERLLAFLDELYIVTLNPNRLQDVYGVVQREMWVHSRIRVNDRKTKVRNSGGVGPEFCDTF